jgi:hypothetical protein
MAWIFDRFKKPREQGQPEDNGETLRSSLLQEEQQENLQLDMAVLEDDDGSREEKLAKVAEKEVQSAAEVSIKRLHVIRMGRCPLCGAHLSQHLFAGICEACGWHDYEVPRTGPVRIHLRHNDRVVEGDRCYIVKTGACLVIRSDVVVARLPREAYDYVEYVWTEDEIDQRHKQVVDRMQISCGWCGDSADPDKDGFHMVHVAFGGVQERYCFCSDDCYEAFRKMYPARVHRNCYERDCSECNLCVKRYSNEAEGIRMLAKDFLTVRKKPK